MFSESFYGIIRVKEYNYPLRKMNDKLSNKIKMEQIVFEGRGLGSGF